jgi:DNA-binding NtrC family response regulator
MLSRVLILEPRAGTLADLAAAFRAACPQVEVTLVTDQQALSRELATGEEGCLVALESGEAMKALRAAHPRLPIVLTAATGDVRSARTAIAAGATDFLVRGGELTDRVRTLIDKAQALLTLLAENRELSRALPAPFEIIGRSQTARRVLALIERVARVPRPVLIEGERGTGKELVARAIHEASGRSGLFVAINCAAVTETLLETELFGYDKGAFTGAERRGKGKFELADGGTLFLDEIGHMPLSFQQKILRAVEYGAFLRVGGNEEVKVSTRVIAATNADLRQMIDAGSFLPDLYDRLAFEIIRVPALRERPEDIEPLAEHFMAAFAREMPEFAGKRLAREAIELLQQYSFPGNVRELKNIIERAVYRDTTQIISLEDIEPLPAAAKASGGSFKARIEALERELVENALSESGGNQAQAARLLGLSYHQFRYFHAKHLGKDRS